MCNSTGVTPSAPICPNPQEYYYPEQESWENYLDLERTTNYASPAPAPGLSEIMFEKPPQSPQPMDIEEFVVPSDQGYYPDCIVNFQYLPDTNYQRMASKIKFEEDFQVNERSQCSKSDFGSEAASTSTKDSAYGTILGENDAFLFNTDSSPYSEATDELESELFVRAMRCLKDCNDEEAQYVQRILPMLLSSLKEIYQNHQLPLDDQIVSQILKELILRKLEMVGEEQNTFRSMANDESNGLRSFRPQNKVESNDLNVMMRKEKKATKGNRNTSNMNHFNENYVSNIFQFARRHYPEDREVQKIGNERNVSAANFRKMIKPNMNDDIMTRKAKARIAGSGKELVQNIEHWMTDGYFEQCSDREKYIQHKEKALRDLALSERF